MTKLKNTSLIKRMEEIRRFLFVQRRILRPIRIVIWILIIAGVVWNSKTLFGSYSLQSLVVTKLEERKQEIESQYPAVVLDQKENSVETPKYQSRSEQIKKAFKIANLAVAILLMYVLVISPTLELVYLKQSR